MSRLQIFSRCDELWYFKVAKEASYKCLFFEHPVNKIVDVATGSLDDVIYEESIITDGNIELNRKNLYSPKVVWQNQLLTLNDGISIPIKISNATFFVTKIQVNDIVGYDIHTEVESEELLNKIINFIYNDKKELFDTESISLKYPYYIRLEKNKNGIKTTEYTDLAPDKKIKKRKKKR